MAPTTTPTTASGRQARDPTDSRTREPEAEPAALVHLAHMHSLDVIRLDAVQVADRVLEGGDACGVHGYLVLPPTRTPNVTDYLGVRVRPCTAYESTASA
jgi:hypothetical protein